MIYVSRLMPKKGRFIGEDPRARFRVTRMCVLLSSSHSSFSGPQPHDRIEFGMSRYVAAHVLRSIAAGVRKKVFRRLSSEAKKTLQFVWKLGK